MNTKQFLWLLTVSAVASLTIWNCRADVEFTGDVHTDVFNYGGPTFWIIGQSGSDAGMTVNGGSVYNLSDFGGSYLIVGQGSTSTNNSLVVSGEGSLLTCGFLLTGDGHYFGGLGNYYRVEAGGGFSVGNGYGGGAGQGSATIGSDCSLIVTDPGSYFSMTDSAGGAGLTTGDDNTITVSNGATVSCTGGGIGVGNGNLVVITDTNTTVNIGQFSANSQNSISISNGAGLNCETISCSGISNTVVFDGPQTRCIASNGIFFSGSIYTNGGYFGGNGYGGALIIEHGAEVSAQGGVSLSGDPAAQCLISDPGTVLTVASPGWLYIGSGYSDTNATLVVSNGASMLVQQDCLMLGQSGIIEIVGTNSLLVGATNQIKVANGAGGNAIRIGEGAKVAIAGLQMGDAGNAATNVVSVCGGLYVTNSSGTGTVELHAAQMICCKGAIVADDFICGSGGGVPAVFSFQSGSLQLGAAMVTNGLPFIVGDGASVADYFMQGGIHSFNQGLVISTNSALSGCGTIVGTVTNYGTIVLSNGCDMYFSNLVVNYGAILALNGTIHFESGFANSGTFLQNTSAISSISFSGPDVLLQVTTVPNYLHDVQFCTNLASGLWLPLTNGLLGTENSTVLTDPGGATNSQRFYRMLLHY